MAELKDILANGEIKTIQVGDTIQYSKAKFEEAEGMFMRIGAGGATELYRVPNQDVVLIDEITVSTPINSAWQEYFSITLTHDITPENGTIVFSGDFFNDSSQDRELWVRMMVNGTQVRSDFIFDLWKDNATDHQQVIMSSTPDATFSAGDVVTLELGADSDGKITMNGNYQPARLKVTLAQVAPVTMSTNDINSFDWNTLPDGDPHIAGRLYRNQRDLLKISQG